MVKNLCGICASTIGDAGSIPGWGIKIPHATWYSQRTTTKVTNWEPWKVKKKKKDCGKIFKCILYLLLCDILNYKAMKNLKLEL